MAAPNSDGKRSMCCGRSPDRAKSRDRRSPFGRATADWRPSVELSSGSGDPRRTTAANGRTRQGFALLAVMCCLIAVSFLVVNWLKTASFERERLRSAERRLQADWLVEAAIERATAQLVKNESYSGETWNIAAADLSDADAAAVEIKVSSNSNRSEQRTIRVSADFPANRLHRVRSTKEVIVDFTLVKQKHNG
jgi:hypothetical protein